jgi:hypothetical protein
MFAAILLMFLNGIFKLPPIRVFDHISATKSQISMQFSLFGR